MRSRSPARRAAEVTGEFALIVVGVIVALFADDYRQRREVTASTTAAVNLLVADLERDSLELALTLESRPGSNPLLALLLTKTDRSAFPADSAEAALHELLVARVYDPARTTFDLLIAQDGLRYIGDLDLQLAIVRYYEEFQDRVIQWNDSHRESWDQYASEYRQYMSPQAASIEQAMDGWLGIDARLTVTWDELRQDNVFMNSIFWRLAYGQIFERELRRTLAENAELRARLRGIPAAQ